MRRPFLIRQRRRFVVFDPWPWLAGSLPLLLAGAGLGFLLYWADISVYDAVFHPMRSLRDIGYGLGEVALELFRLVPYIVASVLAVIAAKTVWRLARRDGGAGERRP